MPLTRGPFGYYEVRSNGVDPRKGFITEGNIHTNNIGLFVQDEVRLRSNLSMDVGLRYDWQDYFHDSNNLAPRFSFAYAPGERGRWVSALRRECHRRCHRSVAGAGLCDSPPGITWRESTAASVITAFASAGRKFVRASITSARVSIETYCPEFCNLTTSGGTSISTTSFSMIWRKIGAATTEAARLLWGFSSHR